jgi:hypothetical protein
MSAPQLPTEPPASALLDKPEPKWPMLFFWLIFSGIPGVIFSLWLTDPSGWVRTLHYVLLVVWLVPVLLVLLLLVSAWWRVGLLLAVLIALLALGSLWGTASVLSDWQERRLGPESAPEAVVAIVSLGTMIGLATKAILSGVATLVQSRGTAEAEKMRAQAQLRLADADFLRAQKGLPGESPGPAAEGVADPAPAEPGRSAGAPDPQS